jgi:hypothetical protein
MADTERLAALNKLRDAVVQGYGDYECTPAKINVNAKPQLTVHEYSSDRVPRVESNDSEKWAKLRISGSRVLRDLVITSPQDRPDIVPPSVYGVIGSGNDGFGILLGRKTINNVAKQLKHGPIYSPEELI